MVTINDLKKLDKQLRQVRDPFGTGFQTVCKLWKGFAKKNGITLCQVGRQYSAWKMKK